jgi:hypothetical protein
MHLQPPKEKTMKASTSIKTVQIPQSKNIGVQIDFAVINRLCKNKKFDQLSDVLLKMYSSSKSKTCSDHLMSKAGKQLDFRSNHSETTCTTITNDQSEPYIHSHRTSASSSTFLHEILLYKPPFKVIDLLCQLLNNERNRGQNGSYTRNLLVEEISDMSGRKPLHVAIQNCCDVNVIARLICPKNARYSTCLSVDSMGRTPLHWAVAVTKSFSLKAQGQGFYFFSLSCMIHSTMSSKGENNTIQVIQLLIKECPRATLIEDMEGNRPIDIARERQVDPSVIIALLEAEANVKETSVVSQKQINQFGLNKDTKLPSHRALLGEQLENLEQQFFPAIDNCINSGTKKVENSRCTKDKKPMKNFLDAVIECSFDEDISLMSCDVMSQPRVFVSEVVSI